MCTSNVKIRPFKDILHTSVQYMAPLWTMYKKGFRILIYILLWTLILSFNFQSIHGVM